jgi:hypothetical protein
MGTVFSFDRQFAAVNGRLRTLNGPWGAEIHALSVAWWATGAACVLVAARSVETGRARQTAKVEFEGKRRGIEVRRCA